MSDRPSQGSRAVTPVTAADVAELALSWPSPISAEAIVEAARAAETVWGQAGVGVTLRARGFAVALVVPATALPDAHPLAGLSRNLAGLLALHSTAGTPDAAALKWLVQGATAYLLDRCPALEAQAGAVAGTPYAPAAGLLAAAGFQPVTGTPGRWRVDLTTVVRARPTPFGFRFRRFGWNTQPAPATRVAPAARLP
ncbi:MAG: hypothetical protein LBR33_08100 [Propionibacteriaceae bacterium]|jgi:hypothetical protein|nr:hypothetical protein [Propionibacteriaceae bacterium]